MAEINITEWIETVKEEPKQGVQALIIVFGIMFLIYRQLYLPKANELEVEQRKLSRVEQELNRYSSAGENIEDIKLEIEDMRESWRIAQQICYKRAEMPEFMRRIRELAQKAGFQVRNVRPGRATNINLGGITVEKFPVTVPFSGDFVTLTVFIRLLETEERIVIFSLPTLRPDNDGQFTFNMELSALVIPDNLL